MKKKKIFMFGIIMFMMVILSVGTVAYFRRTVNGNISGDTGNLVLIVNEADAVLDETFSIQLNTIDEEILPEDRGMFNLNIDSTGSSGDVLIEININKTNIPANLNFYIDENYTKKITTRSWIIRKSDDMQVIVPIYWYWDGSRDDENDSLFINQVLEATITVTATITTYTNLLNSLIDNSELDTDVDFSLVSDETNGQGLMMLDETQNDEYPVVYYRGDVTNNNIIFADYCWLIVRTTETGGTKLIYNGHVNANGGCNNYSGVGGVTANTNYWETSIDNMIYSFDEYYSYGSPVYVGYMNINKYLAPATTYVTHLADDTIDSATGRHVQNQYDSDVKNVIDYWYEKNIKNTVNEELLEDTVWCNDRSITNETYTPENYNTNYYFGYDAYDRVYSGAPSLLCTRDMDKFTVDSANGNGDLDYPIGLLTADEINMAGNFYDYNTTTYLNVINGGYWTMSPDSFYNGYANMLALYNKCLYYYDIEYTFGVRPAISLNSSIEVIGNGTYEQPYIVVY